MRTLIWLRQDLRVSDHPAFQLAVEKGDEILPVYIESFEEEGTWAPGGASRWWIHHSLKALQEDLAQRGLPLIFRKGPALQELARLIKESSATRVFWSRRYEPAIIERDKRIREALKKEVEVLSFNSSLIFEPWVIKSQSEAPFQVYTPFAKACEKAPPPPAPWTAPSQMRGPTRQIDSLTLDDLRLLPKIPWDQGFYQAGWKPGEKGAQEAFDAFQKFALDGYADARNFPDRPGVSRLSPHLHFGEISPWRIWHELKEDKGEGARKYLSEILWREFAYHLLYHFPHTPEKALRASFDHFPWVQDSGLFEKWARGQTGYPIVDAGMQELWTTGWMHNRVRMIVASFLVKDLRISWLEGARWFWDTLLDADLASNTLGWQWAGGCGADAAPYFRIFNPVLQGEKFDPSGAYVKKWLPQLSQVPSKWIHRIWEASEKDLRSWGLRLGENYPRPLVDHAKAREAGLKAFASIKK